MNFGLWVIWRGKSLTTWVPAVTPVRSLHDFGKCLTLWTPTPSIWKEQLPSTGSVRISSLVMLSPALQAQATDNCWDQAKQSKQTKPIQNKDNKETSRHSCLLHLSTREGSIWRSTKKDKLPLGMSFAKHKTPYYSITVCITSGEFILKPACGGRKIGELLFWMGLSRIRNSDGEYHLAATKHLQISPEKLFQFAIRLELSIYTWNMSKCWVVSQW